MVNEDTTAGEADVVAGESECLHVGGEDVGGCLKLVFVDCGGVVASGIVVAKLEWV